MRYQANIHEHDRDYHYSYGRDISIEVDSWQDAVKYCKENSERPFTYTINFLKCNTTGAVYHTEKDMEDAA